MELWEDSSALWALEATLEPNTTLRQQRIGLPSEAVPGEPLSRQELADRVNAWVWEQTGKQVEIDANYVGKLERGVIRWPQTDYRAALRAILGVTADSELGFQPPRRHSEAATSGEAEHAKQTNDEAMQGVREQQMFSGGMEPTEGWHGLRDRSSMFDQAVTVEDMKRRNAMALPMVAAASLVPDPREPWERLTHALKNPSRLDVWSMESLEWRTLEFFRREEYTPSRELVPGLGSHISDLEQLLRGASGAFALRLHVTIGEALTLAAWLAFDCKQPLRAQELLRQAQYAAGQVNDGPLMACTLAYHSYMVEAEGDLRTARELLTQAQCNTRGEHSAATRSWLAAREAEVDAAQGDTIAALRALDRSMTAYDYAHPHQERPWTGFFTPTRLGSMAITTYARLEREELDAAAESVVASMPATDAKIKAVILADIAIAALQRGQLDQAAQFGREALDATLAREAGLGRQRLSDLRQMIQYRTNVAELAELDECLVAEGL